MKKSFQTILIVDLGSQYTQLIARRIRELGVYSEIVDNLIQPSIIKEKNVIGIILSGGPNSVNTYNSPEIQNELLNLNVPILGICYGLQLIGKMIGGSVYTAENQEFGKTDLAVILEDSILFKGLNPSLTCWMSHGDNLANVPDDCRVTAITRNCPIASFECPDRKLYAVQFHPEVTHTPWGIDLLRNFLSHICHANFDWQITDFLTAAVDEIRSKVKDGQVICALSGGVDSLCTAAIVNRAIGKQLHCIFVDHGFMRKDEADNVERTFNSHFDTPLIRVDAREQFLKALHGVTDPEQKRKIIGSEFIAVFDEQAHKFQGIQFLAQGTLYPDVIESQGVGLHSHKIKSHHNVGGLPEKMNLKLIEPLRDLFKDEVRKISIQLGLPPRMVNRHPFPGPGLAIRIIGEVTAERLDILKEADSIVMEEITNAGLYNQVWQILTVMPCVKTVGVMGDARTYGYPVVVRAVTSSDGMTADWARLPYNFLEKISSRIINEVENINRVVYDISSKPPATIEWE